MPQVDWKWFLLSFDGRASRKMFWLNYVLPYFAIVIVAGTIDSFATAGVLTGVIGLAAIWPSIAVGVKRLHDRGKSGWWLLISLIPIIGFIWYVVDLGILGPTPEAARYGADPRADTAPAKA